MSKLPMFPGLLHCFSLYIRYQGSHPKCHKFTHIYQHIVPSDQNKCKCLRPEEAQIKFAYIFWPTLYYTVHRNIWSNIETLFAQGGGSSSYGASPYTGPQPTSPVPEYTPLYSTTPVYTSSYVSSPPPLVAYSKPAAQYGYFPPSTRVMPRVSRKLAIVVCYGATCQIAKCFQNCRLLGCHLSISTC
jgi:hypothetical protein